MKYDPADDARKSYDVAVRAKRLEGVASGEFEPRSDDAEEIALAGLPDAFDMYGRLKEGVHIAGYSFERACTHLEWLLDENRWQLGGRYANVNAFLDSVKLDQFRIVTDQRKRIAHLIKELQPEATNVAIAKVVGVDESTIRADLGKRNSGSPDKVHSEAEETATLDRSNSGNPDAPPAYDIGGAEAAQLAQKQAQKAEKKAERGQKIEAQREALETGSLEMPEGVFEVVVMDPPWNYGREYDPEGSRVANPYPEMTQAELLTMEPPFAGDCAFFLWTTHQFIWDAKALLDHWGFAYKATLVWDKEKIGMGAWLRMQCEFCLVGVRGKPLWDNTKWRDIIREPRREHSRKPETFYAMVEEITAGRRSDYFAREQREGWVAFGNDLERF